VIKQITQANHDGVRRASHKVTNKLRWIRRRRITEERMNGSHEGTRGRTLRYRGELLGGSFIGSLLLRSSLLRSRSGAGNGLQRNTRSSVNLSQKSRL